jgi:hypothetical protein
MRKVYRLKEAIRFEPPTLWSIQARCAIAYRQGEAFTAKAGRLVIHLEPEQAGDEGHLYRLSDGRTGVLNTPPDDRFRSVTDPEVISLAAQVKTLADVVAEKGLRLETISRLDPFRLIVCPMCGETQFSTVDLASVWCDTCNTRFQTRMTAGDPGAVLDATLENYVPERARVIVPRSLMLTLVIKDFGYSSHPDGPCGERCCNATDPRPGGTRGNGYRIPAGIRSTVCRCGLEVYDWSLYGIPELDQCRSPHPVYIRSDGEKEKIPGATGCIYHRRSVRSDRLPSLDLLNDGPGAEREWWYLADCLPRDSGDAYPGNPVWWKVRAQLEPWGDGSRVVGWFVTDRTLCPRCLRPASASDHAYCNWDELAWKPE